MTPKGSRVAPHNKIAWAELCLDNKSGRSLGHHSDTKHKPKVQLPTRVATKEKNHPMLETKKVALCYQGNSCLYRGRYVRRWHYGTKTNRVVATDRMLDGSFVTKASSLKPRPSILYLEAQMYGRNVSWVDKVTTYFLSPNLQCVGACQRIEWARPSILRFAKGEPHEIKVMVMPLTL